MRAFLLSFSLILTVLLTNGQDVDLLPRGSEAIYKATFNVSGNTMTGFLAAKHQTNGVLVVEFTTPMGNNLITMNWDGKRWNKDYAVKQLKSRFVLEILGEDLKYILGFYIYEEDFLDLCDTWQLGLLSLVPTIKKNKLQVLKVYDKQNDLRRTVTYKYDEGEIEEVSVKHAAIPYGLKLQTIKAD